MYGQRRALLGRADGNQKWGFQQSRQCGLFNSYVAQVLAEARLTMQPRYQELLDVIARKPDAVYDALRKFTKSSETSSDQCRPPFQRSSS
jgi:hypothetical protein